MVFHERLSKKKNYKTLGIIRKKDNLKKALEDEWSNILEEDYQPVFYLALKTLQNFPNTPKVNKQLKKSIDMAYDIASSKVLLKHDLMGRIYHKLLLGKLAKYYATYYTSVSAARLLSRLLVTLPEKPTSDEEFIDASKSIPTTEKGKFKGVDFACGSGTLLTALYRDLETAHKMNAENPSTKKLHQYLVEHGLWGFDVLQHATHLATTSLSLQNPTLEVDSSRIYTLPLGEYGSDIFLGSLDFLDSTVMDYAITSFDEEKVGPEKKGVKNSHGGKIELPKFDVCIMNPPFTRNVGGNLLFGDFPKDERKIMQDEMKGLLKEKNLSGLGKSGLPGVFVALADKYLKEGSRMGLVLPKGALSGVSWEKMRQFLIDRYHVEFVLSSFEPDNWNFSEQTELSEVLLIIRKLRKEEEPGYTFFVNFFNRPDNEIESIHADFQLTNFYKSPKPADIENANASPYSVNIGGKKIATVYSAELDSNYFGYYNFFAQSELNRTTALLKQGTIYLPAKGPVGRIPIDSLDSYIVEIGPDRSQIHSNFNKEDTRSNPYDSFWGHDADVVKYLEQEPNSSLNPNSRKKANKLWKRAGNLLIAERVRLNTYRMLSIFTEDKVLSNVWWPVQTEPVRESGLSKNETAKVLALWLNSTFGLLSIASISEVTEGPWISIKKKPLPKLPVPDLTKLDDDGTNELEKTYNSLKYSEFSKLPNQFNKPNIKKEIDLAFISAFDLGLEESDFDKLYESFSQEPMVTNNALY